MKVLLALAVVAACGMAEAKEKAVVVAHAKVSPTAVESADTPTKVARADIAVTRSADSRTDQNPSRNPYLVPLLRDARTIR